MTTTSIDGATTEPSRPAATTGQRSTAALFLAGGLLMAVGGQLHPVGDGATVEAHLLSMFGNPSWNLSHLVLLAGAVASLLALVASWRGRVFGPQVQRWLPVAMIGWAFGAVEMVPHLLAASEAEEFAHHGATPVIDLHLVLQVIVSPAVGLTTALLAVAIARAARTWPARLLAAVAVLGGVLYAGAGPLVVATGDPLWAVLFAFQAGLAVWFVGTGLRLLRRS